MQSNAEATLERAHGQKLLMDLVLLAGKSVGGRAAGGSQLCNAADQTRQVSDHHAGSCC